jgi:hypothetical protein
MTEGAVASLPRKGFTLKDAFLQKNWPKNVFDSKNDVYESPRFVYNKKIDSMV